MWFYCRRSKCRASCIPICLLGWPSIKAGRSLHKFLGIFFDSQFRWDTHVNHVCKRLSYYLYLISYHHLQLPSHILKMLMIDTLVVSQFYALPVCMGPSLGTAAVSRLQRICNRAVRVTCGLRKYDHISAARHSLGWLPFELLVQ